MTTRIKGTGLRFLLGEEEQERDHWAEATSVRMIPETELLPTLGSQEMARGVTAWVFEVTATQNTGPDSFWTLLWEHGMETVPFAYSPTANEIPTVDEPHFTGLVQLPPAPSLGGAADTTYTFTVRLPIVQGPLRVTE